MDRVGKLTYPIKLEVLFDFLKRELYQLYLILERQFDRKMGVSWVNFTHK